MSDLPEVLRADDVAAFLRMGKNKTRRLIATGVIPAIRLGNEYRVYRPALEKWLADNQGACFSGDALSPRRRRALRAGASA